MVLGKLSVPGRPNNSRARAYCALSRDGWRLFGYFFLFSLSLSLSLSLFGYHFSFSFSLSLGGGRYKLKYCLKGPLNRKQPTNQNSSYSVENFPQDSRPKLVH